jgi:tetratricopeptide (TPR) repeat protein
MEARFRVPLEAKVVPLALVALLAAHGANRWLEARHVESAADGNVGVLPDGNAVRVLSLGFERCVADLFWVRTVYYVGDDVASTAKWPGAERLANLVTDTDPSFDTAYIVMSSVLGGLRGDTDAAIRILEKGAAVSSNWRIHFLLGFEYFMEKQEYTRGAECLERAIALGGPPYLQLLVSRLYAHAGDTDTALNFIALRLQNEETPGIREELEQRYVDIWIHRDLALIDAAIANYREAKRTAPKDVQSLVAAGLLPSLPHDPKGGEYFLADGKASTRLEHHELKLNVPGRVYLERQK